MEPQKPHSNPNTQNQLPLIGAKNQEHLGKAPSDQRVDLLQSVLDVQKDLNLIRLNSSGPLNNALSRYENLQNVNSLSLSTRVRLLDSKPPSTWKFDDSTTGYPGRVAPSLCEICRTVNFNWLLHNKTRVFEGPFLGNLESIAQRYDCAFCRLVVRFLKEVYFLEAPGTLAEQGNLECFLSGVRDADGEFFVMLMDHDELRFYFGVRQLGESLGDARLVPEVLDFHLIKSWLSQSEVYDLSRSWIQHSKGEITSVSRGMGSTRMVQLASEFRLIDVKKGCVVRSTISTRYIALSYVWGGIPKVQLQKHNRKELEIEGSLNVWSHLLGQTALDAMAAVHRLGETYLWIDSLCIVQDDPDSRRTQLVSMDEIYRSSVMTIVAVSGENSNAKLPGIEKGSRNIVQIVETIGSVQFVTGLNRFHLFFDRCKWNTRAWTYQEQLLSPRLLFMAPEQVFLKTRNLNFQEDTVGLTRQYQRDTVRITASKNWASWLEVQCQMLHVRQHSIPIVETVNFHTYIDVVENYKKRSLSYPKMDFWNAFSGIVSELEAIFRGPILHGLPQTEIEEALLWYWDGDSVQMKDDEGTYLSPSYGWLAWTGKVRYIRSSLNISCIKWFLQGPQDDNCDSEQYPIEAFRQSPELKTRHQWRYVFDKSRYYYHKDRPDLYFLHPIDPEPERAAFIQSQVVRGNVLIFRAQTALLYLSKKHNPIAVYRTEGVVPTARACEDEVHTICPLSVLDKDGYLAGTVEVPSSISAELLEGKHEFLALSRPHDNDTLNFGPRIPESGGRTLPGGPITGNSDPYIWPSEIFQNMSSELLPETESGTRSDLDSELPFDSQKFDPRKFLPVYTVLLIVWDLSSAGDDLAARRMGIGKIHIDAFAQAKPEEKTIYLK